MMRLSQRLLLSPIPGQQQQWLALAKAGALDFLHVSTAYVCGAVDSTVPETTTLSRRSGVELMTTLAVVALPGITRTFSTRCMPKPMRRTSST